MATIEEPTIYSDELSPLMSRAQIYATREDWLAGRRNAIGGSDSPGVLGVSPWSSQLEVYASKVGEVAVKETAPMKWGNKLEEVGGIAYAEETGRPIVNLGPYTVIGHEENDFMAATPDFVIPENTDGLPGVGIMQFKTTHPRNAASWDEDEAPLHVMVQLAHELAVTGCKWGSVAVLVGTSDFRWYDFEVGSDQMPQSFIDALIQREAAFWQHVVNRQPPELSENTESDARAIEALFKPSKGKEVELGVDSETLLLRWAENDAIEKEAKQNIETCKNALKLLCGDAELAKLPDGSKLSYKTTRRKGHTVEATTYRTLRRLSK